MTTNDGGATSSSIAPPVASIQDDLSGDSDAGSSLESSKSGSRSEDAYCFASDSITAKYCDLFADGAALHIDLSLRHVTDAQLADISSFVQSFHADRYSECSIQSLNLGSNKLSNKAMHYLAPLIYRLPSLLHLDLSFNKIKGKRGILTLGPIIIAHPSLATLVISGNELGASGFNALSGIFKASRSLMRVELGWRTLEKEPPKNKLLNNGPVLPLSLPSFIEVVPSQPEDEDSVRIEAYDLSPIIDPCIHPD